MLIFVSCVDHANLILDSRDTPLGINTLWTWPIFMDLGVIGWWDACCERVYVWYFGGEAIFAKTDPNGGYQEFIGME